MTHQIKHKRHMYSNRYKNKGSSYNAGSIYKSKLVYEKKHPWIVVKDDIRTSFKTKKEAEKFYIDPVTFQVKKESDVSIKEIIKLSKEVVDDIGEVEKGISKGKYNEEMGLLDDAYSRGEISDENFKLISYKLKSQLVGISLGSCQRISNEIVKRLKEKNIWTQKIDINQYKDEFIKHCVVYIPERRLIIDTQAWQYVDRKHTSLKFRKMWFTPEEYKKLGFMLEI